MTTQSDITVQISDPLDLAATCLQAATIHAERASNYRALGEHPAAGVDREEQRYYMKRAEIYLAQSQAESLRSIADDLARIALGR